MSEYDEHSAEAQYARSVLTNNLRVKPKEKVLIEAWSHTLPWAVAFAREARRLKAFPITLYEDEDAYWDAVDHRQDAILGASPEHEWAALGKASVYVHFWGPVTRLRMAQLPEGRREQLLAFNDLWYRSAHKAGIRGVRLEIGRVDPELARAYGVDVDDWRSQVVGATSVDPDSLKRAAAPIAKALESGKRVHITDDAGTDLTLGLKRRSARVQWGRHSPEDLKSLFTRMISLPAGSVRVALDETVADGTLVASRSCYYDDSRATGARFEFKRGKLVDHSFQRGGETFERAFKAAGKGKDMPGTLGFGLNPKLHDTPQLEDIEAGTVLVATGGNRFIGGTNSANFFGFAIATNAEVEIDGKRLAVPPSR
jgi:leucyl aminopeptidase (aminopeptidase T)